MYTTIDHTVNPAFKTDHQNAEKALQHALKEALPFVLEGQDLRVEKAGSDYFVYLNDELSFYITQEV